MWTSRYVARSSGAHALYPVFVHRLAHLIHASFRPRLAAVALASSLGLHLHQAGRRTCTSKLLNMPSTQLTRISHRTGFLREGGEVQVTESRRDRRLSVAGGRKTACNATKRRIPTSVGIHCLLRQAS